MLSLGITTFAVMLQNFQTNDGRTAWGIIAYALCLTLMLTLVEVLISRTMIWTVYLSAVRQLQWKNLRNNRSNVSEMSRYIYTDICPEGIRVSGKRW